MTRKKKILYGAILGLGGMAMLMDRMSAGETGPDSASASTSATLSGVSAEGEQDVILSVAAAPFPRGLPPIEFDSVRDIFAPLHSADGMGIGGGTAGGGSTPAETAPSARAFEASHKLNGVMTGGANAVAIVDGLWLQVGDTLEGCKVAAISSDGVTFACPDGVATLSVGLAKKD